jgi:hypothetical protein
MSDAHAHAHTFVVLRYGARSHSRWYCLLYIPDELMVRVVQQCVGWDRDLRLLGNDGIFLQMFGQTNVPRCVFKKCSYRFHESMCNKSHCKDHLVVLCLEDPRKNSVSLPPGAETRRCIREY